MNEKTWNRVKQIFHDAVARPVAERDAFLAEVCAGDTLVRSEVEELLAAHDDVGDRQTASVGAKVGGAREIEGAGAIIGRYKLLQQIGEGGFGVVYMAEQEEPVRRRVALKIIKLGMDTRQVIARFEAERQALAIMDHPNIAKVLDAGATDTGRPYFVMELVKGVAITEYCDANNLSMSERLQLFVEVCKAVHHAHQKGIIHRDIKPSNVMVTLHDGKPVPRVIDFGVAKATHQRLTEKTLFTAYGQFIGTPAYMSPEQAEMSGLDIDTRSDVYSLGVLLYELLTGTTPFEPESLRSAGYAEIQRMLKEVEPPKPSTRLSTLGEGLGKIAKHRQTDPGALARLIRGDLDWIVMKALEKDRTRRYGSASDLAVDIARHFDNEPVIARPPSTTYRLQKFVVKHKGPVAATTMVVATIVVLGSLSVWQGWKAQRQATRIEEQAMQVRASSILASAAAANDPAVSALLLKELADVPELPGGLRVAREIANRPIPKTILRGHENWVLSVDFSPDGRLIATSGDYDGTARIWRTDGTGEPVVLRIGHKVGAAVFSPDGTQVLTTSGDDRVRIWQTDGEGEPVVLEGSRAAFSPDGSRVVVESHGAAQVWRADGSGQPVVLGAPGEHVWRFAFSRDGARLFVWSGTEAQGSIRVWPADGTGRPVVLRTPRGSGRGAALSPDGQHVLTVLRDGIVRVWAADESDEPVTLSPAGGIAAFSPDGTSVFTANKGGTARIWRVDGTGEPIVLPGESEDPHGAVFSPDGSFVATNSWNGTARVWRTDGSAMPLVLRGEKGQVSSVAFSPDSTVVATGHADGTVRVWPLVETEPLILRDHQDTVRNAAFSPDGALVATASHDGTARLRPADGSGEVVVLQHEGDVMSVAFSPDGTRLVTASRDGAARIWPLDAKGAPVVLPHDGPLSDAELSPDGTRVVTGSEDGTARVWSTDGTGEPIVLGSPAKGGTNLHSVAFSPDGAQVLTGGPWAMAWLWQADGIGAPIELEGYENMWGGDFSPDGNRIIMGCGDGEVRLWNADGTGEPVIRQEHLDEAFSAEFSPDGTRVVTASQDGTARVWWVDGSRETLVLRGHDGEVWSAAFNPDGTRVVTASVDGTARVWRVSWPGLMEYFRESVQACLTPEQRTRFLAESSLQALTAYAACERRFGREPPL